jgi:hypothetical protein
MDTYLPKDIYISRKTPANFSTILTSLDDYQILIFSFEPYCPNNGLQIILLLHSSI